MPYLIRTANRNDVPRLGELLEAYMQETYQGAWGGSTRLLEQHLSGEELAVVVAETSDGEIVGFIAWVHSYDLHWCMKGGDVIDFYICPPHRGRGVAVLLIAKLAADIQEHGGAYLKGGAVDNAVVQQFYQKIAMCLPGGESYVSGRAFRRLAELAGRSLREVVKNLPETAWNYEA